MWWVQRNDHKDAQQTQEKMDEHGEKFNKELAQTEEPNRAEDTITKIKSTLEGIKSRLDNNVE